VNFKADQFVPNSLARPFKSKSNSNGARVSLSITYAETRSNTFRDDVGKRKEPLTGPVVNPAIDRIAPDAAFGLIRLSARDRLSS
jgi:hypothetical protein